MDTDFILPMRNWNLIFMEVNSYEKFDFILPMRNWNYHDYVICQQLFYRILSYLWGIETMKYSTSMMFSHLILSYLWGIETSFLLSSLSSLPSILSYLWGIETYVYSGFFSVAFIGFYLTYEELKRIFFFHLRIWLVWFYLTYEELKHSKSTEKRENLKGFYLTYEELKLNSVPIFITALSDFILPMRNWNLFQIAFACLQGRLDFILPMRNWNFIAFLFAIFLFIGFYLTYEELKPFKICDNFSIVIRILSYLWGIET